MSPTDLAERGDAVRRGRERVWRLSRAAAGTAIVLATGWGSAFGQEEQPAGGGDQADLAAAAQNPIAAMISLPFQNNTFFRTGPDNDTANVLNIQPVIPFNLGDWNVITRTIIPVIYLPSVTDSLPELPSADTTGDDRGGRLRLDSFSLLISGRSAGCRCDVPYSGWHVGRA